MLELDFSGWFQCRLATDPDPHDEPRGVSGYVHAYVGEPDLDRIVHWQPPAFQRPYAPTVGVEVRRVMVNGQAIQDHPLLGAKVNLLGSPKFEGRNGVIAEDGLEPIFPFNLQVSGKALRILRSVVPADKDYPFGELLAGGVEGGPPIAQQIRQATGLSQGLGPVWAERLLKLTADLAAANPEMKPGIAERIAFLRQNQEPGSTQRFFGARMTYRYELASEPELEGESDVLGDVDFGLPWLASFWLGGWDADALCGFALGSVQIPFTSEFSPARQGGLRRP